MKYPIGIQNLGEVRRDGYAYVDSKKILACFVHFYL